MQQSQTDTAMCAKTETAPNARSAALFVAWAISLSIFLLLFSAASYANDKPRNSDKSQVSGGFNKTNKQTAELANKNDESGESDVSGGTNDTLSPKKSDNNFGNNDDIDAENNNNSENESGVKNSDSKNNYTTSSKREEKPEYVPTGRYAVPFADKNYSSMCVDTTTGVTLFAEHSGEKVYPASLTKLMTIYLALRKIKSGELSIHENIVISPFSASQVKSKIDWRAGDVVPIRTIILSAIVASANDSATALGEAISEKEYKNAKMQSSLAGDGDTPKMKNNPASAAPAPHNASTQELQQYLTKAMNAEAKKLGMKHSHFNSASGMFSEENYTTADDMIKLMTALKRDFPEYYNMASEQCTFANGSVHCCTSRVVKYFKHVNGLKTGFINQSMFNLATSMSYDGHDIMLVAFGAPGFYERQKNTVNILNYCVKKMLLLNSSSVEDFEEKYATYEASKSGKNNSVEAFPAMYGLVSSVVSLGVQNSFAASDLTNGEAFKQIYKIQSKVYDAAFMSSFPTP